MTTGLSYKVRDMKWIALPLDARPAEAKLSKSCRRRKANSCIPGRCAAWRTRCGRGTMRRASKQLLIEP